MDEKRLRYLQDLFSNFARGYSEPLTDLGVYGLELVQALREAQAENEWLKEAASAVFNWYYIFGEDNYAGRVRLANLGNALNRMGVPGARTQKDKTLEDKGENDE